MNVLSDVKRELQPSFKIDPFYIHLVTLFTKEFLIQMLYKPRKTRQKFCENQRVFYHI